ncbi:MAG: hypothetical protein PHN77_16405 [Thermoguttaceae bacterium]|jgi:hypothetical protein|nr:hypothetical protein [Thermoguttaceae bacterium]MDI9442639.1 hypothetical protein [Planctomycetota bacterium]
MSRSPQNPTAATRAGTVVFLIDESHGMAAPVAGGIRTKAEAVATAVNSMLNQLACGPPVEVAVVGYRASGGGRGEASPRWAGRLAGRGLVRSEELAAATLSVEERVRRIPGARGHGPARAETIRFPIWYVPAPEGTAAFDAAVACCRQLLPLGAAAERPARPPLILHVGSALPAADVLGGASCQAVAAGALWCHLHLGATTRIPPTLYPSTDAHLPGVPLRALFSASCILPEVLAAALRAAQVPVPPGGRALVYQAAIGDLIRFVTLAKAYAAAPDGAFGPAGSPAAGPPGEPQDAPAASSARSYQRALLILLLDRSRRDPTDSAWSRRRQQANDLVGSLARRGGGDTHLALVSYGSDGFQVGFDGPLAGRPTVADTELAGGALRWEEHAEKRSNGIGGLVEVKRARPIFVDRGPSPAADFPAAALETISRLAATHCKGHGAESVLPIVLHLTGGDFPPESVRPASGQLLLYHWITPDKPQRTVVYPADAAAIGDPRTLALWRITSPLAGAEQLAERRHSVVAGARGLVVGAKFDLLIDSLDAILSRA